MTKAQAIKNLKELGCIDITNAGRYNVWATTPSGHRGLFDPRDLVAELTEISNRGLAQEANPFIII